MANVDTDQIHGQIREFFIDREVYTGAELDELGKDWHFFDKGGLNSVVFADLLDHLFEETGVELDFSEVDIEDISTTETLAKAMVAAVAAEGEEE